MPDICPHCQQPIRKPKVLKLAASVDTSAMSTAEVFAYYKRTDRLETLRFWCRNLGSWVSPELRAGFDAFLATVESVKVSAAAFDGQMNALRAAWRREANARDLQATIDAGHLYDHVTGRWTALETIAAVEAVFEQEAAS